MLISRECVIWNKVINTQLLQGMSPSFDLKYSLCCQYWAYVVVLLSHQGQCNQADVRQQGTHLSNPSLWLIMTRYIEQPFPILVQILVKIQYPLPMTLLLICVKKLSTVTYFKNSHEWTENFFVCYISCIRFLTSEHHIRNKFMETIAVYAVYDLKLSQQQNTNKSSQAIGNVNIESVSDTSETVSSSVISVQAWHSSHHRWWWQR